MANNKLKIVYDNLIGKQVNYEYIIVGMLDPVITLKGQSLFECVYQAKTYKDFAVTLGHLNRFYVLLYLDGFPDRVKLYHSSGSGSYSDGISQQEAEKIVLKTKMMGMPEVANAVTWQEFDEKLRAIYNREKRVLFRNYISNKKAFDVMRNGFFSGTRKEELDKKSFYQIFNEEQIYCDICMQYGKTPYLIKRCHSVEEYSDTVSSIIYAKDMTAIKVKFRAKPVEEEIKGLKSNLF